MDVFTSSMKFDINQLPISINKFIILIIAYSSYTFFVSEPITTLLGAPELYINKGSTMNLTCMVKHSPEPPPSIYWTHNSQVSVGIFVIYLKGLNQICFSFFTLIVICKILNRCIWL